MIGEYAVNPELLLDQDMCRLLALSFGIHRGRLVSQFPKHWESLVWAAIADAKPVAKKRIEETLARLSKRTFPRLHEWIDGDWLDEALREHSARPFHAILSRRRDARCREVLAEDDLDETNVLWNVETTCSCRRTAIEMSKRAELLLARAKEILFIDPYFRLEHRFLNPLRAFLNCVNRRTTGVPILSVEYHTVKQNEQGTDEWFAAECDRQLHRLIPSQIPFRLVRWQKHERHHNRYILTNDGGLMFGHGLDESEAGVDQVVLLGACSHAGLWADYRSNPYNFTLFDQWKFRSTAK